MTGPDCAVMCNLINSHTHTHTVITCEHPTAPFTRPGVYKRVLGPRDGKERTGPGGGSETGTGARVGTGTQTVMGMGTEREHERVVEANERT